MQPLNYAAQAASDIKKYAMGLSDYGWNEDAEKSMVVANLFATSVHFQISDGGRILDDDLRGICNSQFDFRLPFPLLSISFTYKELAENVDVKRCIIAIDDVDKIRVITAHGGHGGWFLLPIMVNLQKDKWNAQQLSEADKVAHCDFNSREKLVAGAPVVMLQKSFDAYCRKNGTDEETALLEIISGVPLRSVLELIEALSCSNVSHEPIQRADNAVNARRVRAGKLPLYEIRMLTITVPERKVTARSHPGGTHASPREHLRRGHIRNLSDGKKVWVQSCVVSGGYENGKISKGYSVQTS